MQPHIERPRSSLTQQKTRHHWLKSSLERPQWPLDEDWERSWPEDEEWFGPDRPVPVMGDMCSGSAIDNETHRQAMGNRCLALRFAQQQQSKQTGHE
jgi:hypothetical protein